MPFPIGIDLGTTFSSISVYKDNKSEIINDEFSERHIPSVVYYDPESGETCVGKVAIERSTAFPENLLKDAKRIIGRKYDDEMIKKSFHLYQLAETDTGMAAYKLEINGQTVLKKPEEVSAEVLKYLVKYATEYLEEPVEEAVITVPAYFSGAQRKATMAAAEKAGINVLKLMSEPVAAALHYVTEKDVNSKILVFDFGGGTLDVSLIEVCDQKFQVKAVAGDTSLGGRNIDEDLFKRFFDQNKIGNNKRKIQRLEDATIDLKENLSSANKVTKILDAFNDDEDLTLKLDVRTFDELNQEIFERALEVVKVCLRNGNWSKDDVEQVILVGGSSRIPKVRTMLAEYFGEHKIKKDLNPQEAVAHGACLQAAIIKDVGALENYDIREVTPLSLGIECYGGIMEVVIPKNTPIPANGTSLLTTVKHNQSSAEFSIFEGERTNCKYNNQLGSFTIENLPKKAAGEVKLNAIFSLDADGILSISATETSTGQNKTLSVTIGEFKLNDHQVNMNIVESEQHKEEDDKFEKFILRRNKLIQLCSDWEYKYDAYEIEDLCEAFRNYAENLDYNLLNDLNVKFAQFKLDITEKISTSPAKSDLEEAI